MLFEQLRFENHGKIAASITAKVSATMGWFTNDANWTKATDDAITVAVRN